jgi:hypothetical protein
MMKSTGSFQRTLTPVKILTAALSFETLPCRNSFLPDKLANVSEFLQFIGITVFFYGHFLVEPYGMMEYWNVGILGMRSGKRSILKKCCIYIL